MARPHIPWSTLPSLANLAYVAEAIPQFCVYWSVEAFKQMQLFWASAMGASALLFNPVLPVHMARSDWQVVNLVEAAFLAVWMLSCFYKERRKPWSGPNRLSSVLNLPQFTTQTPCRLKIHSNPATEPSGGRESHFLDFQPR